MLRSDIYIILIFKAFSNKPSMIEAMTLCIHPHKETAHSVTESLGTDDVTHMKEDTMQLKD